MLLEIVIVVLPFIVGLVILGLGHDITDRDYLETLNERAER